MKLWTPAPNLAWRMVPVLVAIIGCIPFLPAISGEFLAWDDRENFIDNPAYRGLGIRNLEWMWTTFHMGHYIPLSWMSLGLDFQLSGMDPRGYHITNILLHGANAALVFYLFRQLVARALPECSSAYVAIAGVVAALFFAVHPLRVESVAWITERRDVLSLLFFLTTLILYCRYDPVPGVARRIPALLAFTAAVLSKGSTVTLPAVLLILNVFPLRRLGGEIGWLSRPARRVYSDILPFAIIAAAFSALSVIALNPGRQLDVIRKVAVSAYSLCFYLWKTVLPSGLSPLYPMPAVIDPTDLVYVTSVLAALLVTVVAWLLRRRFPVVLACWVAFAVICLPTLGVVQNGPQIAADRYTYHGSTALAMLLGAGLLASPARAIRPMAIAATFVLGAFSVIAWRQSWFWQTSERLWTRVVDVQPHASLARTALANELLRQARPAEAIPHYRASLAVDSTAPEAINNLGIALAATGDFPGAIRYYERAIAMQRANYEAQNNWGAALSALGQHEAAIPHFRAALEIRPDFADAHVNWGNALLRLGQPANAVDHYRRAAQAEPGHLTAQLNWGVALIQQGDVEAAIGRFKQALAIQPGHPDARNYLEQASRLRKP
jgi:protein O-mannosyl-transferase